MSDRRNPITNTFVKKSVFDRAPVAPNGSVLIVVPKRGTPYVIQPGGSIRNADYGAAQAVYEINTAAEAIYIDDKVESSDDAFGFGLKGQISYIIAEPLKVVIERRVTDTCADIRGIVKAAVNMITRDLNPHRFEDAQRAVRQQGEGQAGLVSGWLKANGYNLNTLSLSLSRDQAIISLAQETHMVWERERLREAQRDSERREAAYVEEGLRGDVIKRLALVAARNPAQLPSIVGQLTEQDLEIAKQELQILSVVAPDLEDHQKQRLAKQIQQRLERNFNSSRAIKGDTFGVLGEGTPAPAPPPDDASS